jgi:hypothetical protein
VQTWDIKEARENMGFRFRKGTGMPRMRSNEAMLHKIRIGSEDARKSQMGASF